MPIDDGGPAFPLPPTAFTEEQAMSSLNEPGYLGMTLRDYFAAKAMQAFIASGLLGHLMSRAEEGGLGLSNDAARATTAHASYNFADAMLAQRTKEPTK